MADQTTVAEPWAPQQPFLQAGFDAFGQLASTPRGYYPGQGYVNFSAPTEMAMGMQAQRALAGSPYEAAMGQYLTNALGQQQMDLTGAARSANQLLSGLGQGQSALGAAARGDFVGANPYLDQQFGAASDAMSRQFQNTVMPGINATFGAGGRTGSHAHTAAMENAQQAYGNQLGNLASNMYGGAYESERGRMQQAATSLQQGSIAGLSGATDIYGRVNQAQLGAGGLAPSAQQMSYNNINQLMGVGSMVDEQQRAMLQSNMDRYSYLRDTPYEQMNWYMGGVGGQGYGGTQYTDSGGSGIGRVLGGAGTGAGIGAAIGTGIMPGIGTGIGAGVGALGGGILGYFA